MNERKPDDTHWLVQPKTVKALWIGFIIILILTVLGDFLVHHKAYFGVDGTFGFGAWFGFGSCLILVGLAKLVGFFLKRPEKYYDH